MRCSRFLPIALIPVLGPPAYAQGVVAGQTDSKGAGGIDAWILKLDGKGRLLGEKTFGGKKSDAAHNIVALPDGWLALSGYTDSKGTGLEDLWFVMMQPSQMSLARQK